VLLLSNLVKTAIGHQLRRRRLAVGRPQKSGQIFSGKYHVKSGHFLNVSYFRTKMSCPPPKFTEPLRIWSSVTGGIFAAVKFVRVTWWHRKIMEHCMNEIFRKWKFCCSAVVLIALFWAHESEMTFLLSMNTFTFIHVGTKIVYYNAKRTTLHLVRLGMWRLVRYFYLVSKCGNGRRFTGYKDNLMGQSRAL